MYLSDDKMREFYRQNEEAYWRGVLATAKAEGIAEGKAEGKAEERKNLLEAARTMLSEGMDRLKVQHFTKLTDEEMKRIEPSCATGLFFLAGPLCVLAVSTSQRLMPMLSKD